MIPPLVKGGQGRSGRSVAESAIVYGIGAVGLVITVMFAAAGAPGGKGLEPGAPLSLPRPSAAAERKVNRGALPREIGAGTLTGHSGPLWLLSPPGRASAPMQPGVRLFIRPHAARPSLLRPEHYRAGLAFLSPRFPKLARATPGGFSN